MRKASEAFNDFEVLDRVGHKVEVCTFVHELLKDSTE